MQRVSILLAAALACASWARALVPAGFPAWAAPEPVSELNTSGDEWTPWISADGLTILFSREPAGSPFQRLADIRMATRPNRSSPFEASAPLAELNTPDNDELMPTMTADGLEIFFFREGATAKLMTARRDTVADSFDPPTQATVTFETATLSSYPQVSPDGLTLYLTGRTPTPPGALLDVFVSTRPDRGSAFSTAAQLPGLSIANSDETGIWISPDGLKAWTAHRPQTGSTTNVALAKRASTAAAFGTPVAVGELAAGSYTASAAVTADGEEMYFFSNRPGGQGGLEIWRARKAAWSVWVMR